MQELSGTTAGRQTLLRPGMRSRLGNAATCREAARETSRMTGAFDRKPGRQNAVFDTPEEKIRRVLLECNGQWLSARSVAAALGVAYQAVARRLHKMARSDEIDIREVEFIAERYRIRRSHLYRAWGGWTVFPSWMAPRGCESDVKRARLVIGRASIRDEGEE